VVGILTLGLGFLLAIPVAIINLLIPITSSYWAYKTVEKQKYSPVPGETADPSRSDTLTPSAQGRVVESKHEPNLLVEWLFYLLKCFLFVGLSAVVLAVVFTTSHINSVLAFSFLMLGLVILVPLWNALFKEEVSTILSALMEVPILNIIPKAISLLHDIIKQNSALLTKFFFILFLGVLFGFVFLGMLQYNAPLAGLFLLASVGVLFAAFMSLFAVYVTIYITKHWPRLHLEGERIRNTFSLLTLENIMTFSAFLFVCIGSWVLLQYDIIVALFFFVFGVVVLYVGRRIYPYLDLGSRAEDRKV
jgi:hypothetical protein